MLLSGTRPELSSLCRAPQRAGVLRCRGCRWRSAGKRKKMNVLKKALLNRSGRGRKEVAALKFVSLFPEEGNDCPWASLELRVLQDYVSFSARSWCGLFPSWRAPIGPKGNRFCSPISTLELSFFCWPSAPCLQTQHQAGSSHRRGAGLGGRPRTCTTVSSLLRWDFEV